MTGLSRRGKKPNTARGDEALGSKVQRFLMLSGFARDGLGMAYLSYRDGFQGWRSEKLGAPSDWGCAFFWMRGWVLLAFSVAFVRFKAFRKKQKKTTKKTRSDNNQVEFTAQNHADRAKAKHTQKPRIGLIWLRVPIELCGLDITTSGNVDG